MFAIRALRLLALCAALFAVLLLGIRSACHMAGPSLDYALSDTFEPWLPTLYALEFGLDHALASRSLPCRLWCW